MNKRIIKDNHAFSKLDFYRRCVSLMKLKEKITSESILSEFEKLLDIDSPYIFYSDDHGFCINTEDALEILVNIINSIQ